MACLELVNLRGVTYPQAIPLFLNVTYEST